MQSYPYPHYPPSYSSREDYQRALQDQQKRREEAEKQRLAALQAECERNRGTDCNNPQTLRQMEAQQIPGGKSYRAPRN